MRRFAILGQKATSDGAFLLDDLPGTSGRLDVLLRCLRAAFLTSHGLRRDVIVYLVLMGTPERPRVVRFDGRGVRFLRPDERSLAVLAKKVLGAEALGEASGFVEVKPGIAVACGGFEKVLADAPDAVVLLLDEGAPDLRTAELGTDPELLVVIGDHLGVPEETRSRLDAVAARCHAIGPISVHADDAVAIVTNELDRRALGAS